MLDELVDEIAREHLNRVNVKDEYVAAACPFHKGGRERNPSFWINRTSGKWGCFSCEAHGSSLKYLLIELGVKSGKAEAILEVAESQSKKLEGIRKTKKKASKRKSFKGSTILDESTGILGVYNFTPVDLVEDGFSEEILEQNDVGYDRERDRITFPIRDIDGNLVGISGRTVTGAVPKYKVYEGPHNNRDGVWVPGELGEWFPEYASKDIRDHLYGANECFWPLYRGETEQLIIVEGYKARLWMRQHDYPNVVALMGAHMSPQQERLIRRMGTDTWVFLDANEAGRKGSKDICWRLGNATFRVYEVQYPTTNDDPAEGLEDSRQPDDLDAEMLEQVLSTATRRSRKRRRGLR